MKNLLITGGTGFIGKNLMEHFNKDYRLFAPPHRELDLIDTEKVKRYVSEHKIDVVIHGAIHVEMFNGHEKLFYNDMLMFANIEKISHEVEKVIYFGSGAEYDKTRDITLVKEEQFGESIPLSEYALAKYLMNIIARESENIYNLRLFGIFGKYELWDIKFISNVICKALYDIPVTIRKECLFDYLYIDDLMKVVRWAVESKPRYHDYNVVMGTPYKLSELAEMAMGECGKDPKYKFLTDGKANDYTASNHRLCEEMGSAFISSMQSAIANLSLYYRSHLDEIDYDTLCKSR